MNQGRHNRISSARRLILLTLPEWTRAINMARVAGLFTPKNEGGPAFAVRTVVPRYACDVAEVREAEIGAACYPFVLFGGGSGGSQAESSGPPASASIRAAITKSDSCRPPILRVVKDTSQKPNPNASSG